MAKQSLITGGRGFVFRGFDFTKWVTSWQDTRTIRNASHEYLKRDGGEGEGMGRAPHVATIQLCFVGETWRDDYLALQAKIDEDAGGLLTHPVFDDMQVRCDGVQNATMNVEESPNQYEITLTFREDKIDSKVASSPTASGQRQEIDHHEERYNASYSTQFSSSSSQVTAFFSAAKGFTAAVESTQNNRSRDPSLSSQLESCRKLAATAISALRSDPASRSDATSSGAVAIIEQAFDACGQLLDLVGQQGMVGHVVPAPIHVAALAAQFYGREGYTRIAEILANNGIANPGMIPAGTRLVMAPATTPKR